MFRIGLYLNNLHFRQNTNYFPKLFALHMSHITIFCYRMSIYRNICNCVCFWLYHSEYSKQLLHNLVRLQELVLHLLEMFLVHQSKKCILLLNTNILYISIKHLSIICSIKRTIVIYCTNQCS